MSPHPEVPAARTPSSLGSHGQAPSLVLSSPYSPESELSVVSSPYSPTDDLSVPSSQYSPGSDLEALSIDSADSRGREAVSPGRSLVSVLSEEDALDIRTPSQSQSEQRPSVIKHDECHIFLMVNNRKLIEYSQKLKADIESHLHHTVKITKHRGRARTTDEMDQFMVKRQSEGSVYVISIGLFHEAEERVDLFILNGLTCVQELRNLPWTMGFRIIQIVSDGVKNPVPVEVGAMPAHEAVLLRYIGVESYQASGEVVRIIPQGVNPLHAIQQRRRSPSPAPTVDIISSDSDLEAIQPATKQPNRELNTLLENISTSSENESNTNTANEKTDTETKTLSKNLTNETVSVTNADQDKLKISETAETEATEKASLDAEAEEGEITSSDSCESISDESLDNYTSDNISRQRHKSQGSGHKPRRTLVMPPGWRSKSESDEEEHERKLANRQRRFEYPSQGHIHRNKRIQRIRKSHRYLHERTHRETRQTPSSSSTSTSTSSSDSESSDNRPRLGKNDFN